MFILFAVFIALVLLDIAALRWGFDSWGWERNDSPEWERRTNLSFPLHHS